jgi:hypothetical protein
MLILWGSSGVSDPGYRSGGLLGYAYSCWLAEPEPEEELEEEAAPPPKRIE